MYQINQPIATLNQYIYTKITGKRSPTEKSRLINKCEETLDRELTVNNIVQKLRLLEEMVNDQQFLHFDLLEKLDKVKSIPIEINDE